MLLGRWKLGSWYRLVSLLSRSERGASSKAASTESIPPSDASETWNNKHSKTRQSEIRNDETCNLQPKYLNERKARQNDLGNFPDWRGWQESPSAKRLQEWKLQKMIEHYSQAIQHRIPDTCLWENGADSGVLHEGCFLTAKMQWQRMFINNQPSTKSIPLLQTAHTPSINPIKASCPPDSPAVPLGLIRKSL